MRLQHHLISPRLPFCTGHLAAVTLGLFLLLFSDGDAAAAIKNPYMGQVNQVFTELKIQPDDTSRIKTLERRHHSANDQENDRLLGYYTYVRFHHCKGYLTIRQHRFGRVEDVFTRGECRFPGVKHFNY